jgi:hypothetical protein
MQNLGMLSLDQEMCFAVEMSKVSTVRLVNQGPLTGQRCYNLLLCNSVNWQASVVCFCSDGSEEDARSHPMDELS